MKSGVLTTACKDLCDPAHCSYLRVVTSHRACVPRLTKQLPHPFVLALPSSWNVLLLETHMACFQRSLLKCDFIREVFPYLLYKIGSSQFQTLYIPLSSLIDFHIICHHGPFLSLNYLTFRKLPKISKPQCTWLSTRAGLKSVTAI